MDIEINKEIFKYLTKKSPNAFSIINGGENQKSIKGLVNFYQLPKGVIVIADIEGLPRTKTNIFAFHIHECENCDENFVNTGGHYNPTQRPHPEHAGDMPPLFSNDGDAWQMFFTSRFKVEDIIGKTIIIHDNVDDFTSQPSGNSGNKIACGVIKRL